MQGDIFNHKKARGIAILGLLFQFFLFTVPLTIYALYSGGFGQPVADHAAVTAAAYSGIGSLVWVTLIFLFDWHRRERQEAMEAERLADDPAASAFESGGDELRVAARRLAGIQRFGLPIMSLIVGASLVITGVVRLRVSQDLVDPGLFRPTAERGFAIAVGLGVAFIGFVFARFVSGMAKQKVWAALRAGASFAAGSALLAIGIVVGHFVDIAGGPDTVLRYLQVAYPIFMIVMGAEVFLNFVATLYVPRKAGEDPRPAFDSRILAYLAAPDQIAQNIGDALNYQFGIEISRTWFYQLIRRWWPALIALVVLVMWSMTSLVVIEPHQRAVLLTFGKPAEETLEPGVHFKWPYPISEVYIPEAEVTLTRTVKDERGRDTVILETVEAKTATGVRMFNLGTNAPDADAKAILWTNQHTAEEFYNIVQPSSVRERRAEATADSSSELDVSLVAIEATVHWAVDDVYKFDTISVPESRDRYLQVLGQRMLLQHLASKPIDDVLGGARTELPAEIRERLISKYGNLGPTGEGAGVEVIRVGTGSVHPPRDVAPTFERVVEARQQFEARLADANRDKIRILTEVAPPVPMPDGTTITAEDIVDMIDEIERMRRDGANETQIAAESLRVQQILERSGGEAGSELIDASAQRWARHMGERGRAALYEGQIAAYAAAPTLYMSRHYFDALRSVMADARVFLVDSELKSPTIRLQLESQERGLDVFDPEAGAEESQF